MRTRTAVLRSQPGKWDVVETELDVPRQGEILLRMVASGLCHSDAHCTKGEQPMAHLPLAGGHEGAGVVAAVGPNTPGWAEGDHVVLSFLPVCGRCRMCATGRQNLCDLGAAMFTGARPEDPASFRMQLDGHPVAQMGGISTHSEYTLVDVRSAVKIDQDVPLDRACLLGCGVATGWGSAEHVADVRSGDVVIVAGIGGVGINSVQAAAALGAGAVIAVDPVAFKREKAREFGATHTVETIEAAGELARSMTNGQGADSTIITVGVVDSGHVDAALATVRKAGTVVVTSTGETAPSGPPLDCMQLTVFQKRIQGALYGAGNPTWEIPRLLGQYRTGGLKLDELVTRHYPLDEINQGYEDMLAGELLRGVIVFD